MQEEQRFDVSAEELQSLADQLEKFAQGLSDEERTVLTSIVVLAGKQLRGGEGGSKAAEEHGGRKVEIGDRAALQASFAQAFDKFAPGAFGRVLDPGGLRAGTVCIE